MKTRLARVSCPAPSRPAQSNLRVSRRLGLLPTVWLLAVQADGKVLVGGDFTRFGGQPRNRLARLSLPEAALQHLSVRPDRNSLTWQRSGAGPELERVWFEQSPDGVAYAPLGEAERIPGGWTLDGLALPQNQSLRLRARGISRGGVYNGSGSLIESVLWFHARNVHEVTLNASGSGMATPPTQTVNDGEDATITLTPDANHHVDAVTGDTCAPIDNGDGTWTAANITAACTVTASFVQNAAAGITAQGGDGQSSPVLAAFADALAVRVADAADVPLAGITVSFAAPGSGASATLSTPTAITDASGIASITATANGEAGSYAVTASVAGVAAPASFALTNTPFSTTLTLTASPAMLPPGGTATLSATVTGEGSLIPGGTVDFYVDGGLVCAAVPVDAAGIATCEAGPFPAGAYTVSASYSGDAAHAPATSGAGIGFGVSAPAMVPVNGPWALALLIALLALFGTALMRRA